MPSVLRGRHRSLPGGRRTESRRGKGLPVERTRADSPSRPSCGRSRLTRRRRSGSEKPLLLSHRTRSSGDIPANSTLRRSRISRVVFTQSNPLLLSRGRHFLPPSCRSRYVTDISRSDRVARGAVLCPHSGHELRSHRTDRCVGTSPNHSTPESFFSAWGLRTMLMYLPSVVVETTRAEWRAGHERNDRRIG